ncbi:hypothetical protein [Anaerotignum sp.]|uniref:hypothetical protein n=1 Tax=Anaerotignum sp. TaxID=2039241 RepID=UPI0028A953E2|nr:hypothetical protein [Anaerotignum sp.]
MKKILSMALSFMLITTPIIAFAEAPILPNEEENILDSSAATKYFIKGAIIMKMKMETLYLKKWRI